MPSITGKIDNSHVYYILVRLSNNTHNKVAHNYMAKYLHFHILSPISEILVPYDKQNLIVVLLN